MRDFIEFFGVLIIVSASIIAMLMLGGNYYEQYKCNNWERMTGERSEYVFMDSCYVEYDGKMRRWDEYKEIQKEVTIK